MRFTVSIEKIAILATKIQLDTQLQSNSLTLNKVETSPSIEFKEPEPQAWQEAARKELDGEDPFEKISFNKGKLKLKPYYSATATAQMPGFALTPSSQSHYGARSWVNLSRVLVNDAKQANEAALQLLNTGADGILFELQATVNMEVLLHQLNPDYCTISFNGNNFLSISVDSFISYIEKNNYQQKITGCIFWQEPIEYQTLFKGINWPKFSPYGIVLDPATEIDEAIAHALEKAVKIIEEADKVESVITKVAFSLSADTDFFLTIASIKSLRNLWCQIQGAYGLAHIKQAYVHATSTAWVKEHYQPHGNMIKSTTAAMAAIMGGCSSLLTEAEDDKSLTQRIARNVSSVLREESYFSKVADPTAGSYFLDAMVAQLSEHAWHTFQAKMK